MKRVFLTSLATVIVIILIFTGCSSPAPSATSTPVQPPTTGIKPTTSTQTPVPSTTPSPVTTAKIFELSYAHMHQTWDAKQTGKYIPWAQAMEQAGNGQIKIKIYPAETLVKAKDMYDAVLGNIADIGDEFTGYWPGRFPRTDVMLLPGLGIHSSEMMGYIAYNLYKKGLTTADYPGVKVLEFSGIGDGHISMKSKAIRTVADIKGTKIRVGSSVNGQMITALGGTPILMPGPDTYTALDKGVVDGILINLNGVDAFGLWDVTKYHTKTPYSGVFFQSMNLNTWNSLPKDIQDNIEKQVFTAEWAMKDSKVMDVVDAQHQQKQAGSKHEFIDLSKDELAKLDKDTAPIRDQWLTDMKAKGIDGQALLDETVRLVSEYNQKFGK